VLALTATALTFVLIAVGALVRATGSGDACPDWPRCFGRWIPRVEYHVLIEYSHRLTATLDIVAVAALAVYAWRRYRSVPRVFRPSVAALGLIVVQAALGGIVVLTKLEALNVTLHLGTAMVVATTLVLASVAAYSVDAKPSPRLGSFTVLARFTAGWAFALILVGGWVRGAGAGLAFGDWPLMDGRVVPDLTVRVNAIHFAHRTLALGLGVLIVVLLVRAWRLPARDATLAVLASVAAACYVGQVLVGASLVWTSLGAASEVAHVALAGLIWGSLVAVAAASQVSVAERAPSDAPVPALETT
jgi:heme a synthase